MNDDKFILEEKNIILEWDKGLKAEAYAFPLKNKITLTKALKKILNEKEFSSILIHERGHFELYNFLLPFVPVLLIFCLLLYAFLSGPKSYSTRVILNCLFILFFILLILSLWLKEILADIFAVKRTEIGIFKRALIKVHKYNNKFYSKFDKFLKVITHPLLSIRLVVINNYENSIFRDRIK